MVYQMYQTRDKMTLAELLTGAIERYQARYGVAPTVAYVNRDQAGELGEFPGLQIKTIGYGGNVLKGCIQLGVE